MNIIVIGSINTDVIGTPLSPLTLRDSNIGRVTLRAGGVGRNIAENLVRLGADVQLITALGTDGFSSGLRAHCAAHGVGLDYAPTTGDSCGVYLCVNDEAGDMFVALNDMRIMDALTPELVDMDALNASDGVVLDANLPIPTLEYVASSCTAPLFADPVSVAKAERLSGILPRLTAIKPNLYEARLLTGCDMPEDCAKELVQLGVSRAYVSLGAEGMAWADGFGAGKLPAFERTPVCTTGAGDSATAALCVGQLRGLDALSCAAAACRAAALTIMSQDAVSEELTAGIFKTKRM